MNNPQYDPNPGDVASLFSQYHRICLSKSDMGVTCRFEDEKNPTDEPRIEMILLSHWVDWHHNDTEATYTRSAEVHPSFWGI